MPLAGVMGAGMPEPIVLVPMPLEPMGALLELDGEELEESVDGEVMGAGGGKTTVSSTFLLQAPNASKAASATEVAARVLMFELNMRISFEISMKLNGFTRGVANCQSTR